MPDKLRLHADKFLLALGSLLRDARISRKITQEQLAREAQIDRSYVSMIERGLANPRIHIPLRIPAQDAASPKFEGAGGFGLVAGGDLLRLVRRADCGHRGVAAGGVFVN